MLVRHIRDTFKLHSVRQLTRIASGALFVACIVGSTTSNAQTTSVQDLVRLGTTSFNGASTVVDGGLPEIPRIETDRDFHNIGAPSHPGAPNSAADPPGNAVNTPMPGTVPGFIGLSHFDQRNAGTGAYLNTQFSLEPPDQGLCAGNGFVVETINTAIRVYSATTLAPLTGVMAINQFFKLTPEVIRPTPAMPAAVFGDFTSDPKCLYDADTGRFFLTVLQLDVNPANGAFTGPSSVLIAVSQTSDPTKGWNLFKLITTDDGTHGTLSNPNCPCFGDQPLIGLNPDGFFITTNEFPTINNGFNGAQVYGMSKSNLVQANGSLPKVVHINAGSIPAPDGGIWYTLQPATPPPGASPGKGQLKNTEFFMSALDFNATLDNRIAVWSLFNTSALVSGNPAAVKLNFTIVATETYGQPPVARQKSGPGIFQPQLLNTNDDRMNQVVYADGLLYSGVNTILGSGLTQRAGIAYFIVAPSIQGHSVSASIAKQGYVSVTGNDVLFPSIGVNKFGAGVMSFTLAGPDYWPSGAYAKVNSATGAGAITISIAGVAPEDGFTAAQDGGVARWGDYSAAYADENGVIWIGTECIPVLAPRTAAANWGTCISPVMP
jgi:hypothetical protein